MSLPTSVSYNYVDFATVWAENDEREANFANVILPFPFKTFPEHPEPATISDAAIAYAELLYLDGSPVHLIDHAAVTLTAVFDGAGAILTATVPNSSLPDDFSTKAHILHFVAKCTIS